MADSDDCQKIMDLANLIREKGYMLDPESDEDETDRWALPCGYLSTEGVVVFHAHGEMSNRLYLALRDTPYNSVILDVIEETIFGFKFPKGSEKELDAVHKFFQNEINQNKKEMLEQDAARKVEGLSVVDGQGRHKL